MKHDKLSTSKDLELIKDGDIYYLLMGQEDNNYNLEWGKKFNTCLDEAENSIGPGCLVTVGTGPKVFHSGLDLDTLKKNPLEVYETMQDFSNTLMRMLTFPMPTLAVINGHALMGGMMLALTHDHRIMREDKGFLCVGAVNLNLPLPEGLTDLLGKVLSPQSAREIIYGGKFGSKKAMELELINSTYNGNIDMLNQIKRF